MTSPTLRAGRPLLCALLCLAAGTLRAAVYTEVNTGYNSHDLVSDAELVPYNSATATDLSSISGRLSISTGSTGTGFSEGDLYQIYISSPSTFSATTTNTAPNVNGFDSQLFLFNASGDGIAANDNAAGGGTNSTLPAGNALYSNLLAGYYYLLITGGSHYPAGTTSMDSIFPNQTEDGLSYASGVYGPRTGEATDPFGLYIGNSTEGNYSNIESYSIALTGAMFSPVPEPGTFAWIAAGAGVLGLIVRRRRRQPRSW